MLSRPADMKDRLLSFLFREERAPKARALADKDEVGAAVAAVDSLNINCKVTCMLCNGDADLRSTAYKV
jgi:hypothetical protein